EVWEGIGIEGAEVRVAKLPPGEDPDSLIYGGKTAQFQQALDEAMPRVEFEIDAALKRHDTDTDEGRGDALTEIIPILAGVQSLTQRDKYVERVAGLHPARRFDFRRAMDALLADIEEYRRRNGPRPARGRGYPLTERANRAPLANTPAPPEYRPPAPDSRGRWEPGTANVQRAGGTPNPEYRERSGERRTGGRYDRRAGRDPLRDYGPPSLALPPLSGPERAERQLLRALFTADWRTFVLGRVPPDLFISRQAREVFNLAARTPAREDGSIDPAVVFREAEVLDEAREPLPAEPDPTASEALARAANGDAAAGQGADLADLADPLDPPDPATPTEGQPAAADLPDVPNAQWTDRAGSSPGGDEPPAAAAERAANSQFSRRPTAKTSDFIREVLEDSLSVMSNEPLSEAALNDCIRRLQMHREEQTIRNLLDRLSRPDLTPEERRSASLLYHEKKRQSRGSPPAVEDDNG
ncbi:MAG TPA: hypothetical protein VKT77_05625, partial [Chthonomonadaceae bacterium]|nr:hypothetical protein [Chthonomonadaceae bacterium]